MTGYIIVQGDEVVDWTGSFREAEQILDSLTDTGLPAAVYTQAGPGEDMIFVMGNRIGEDQ